MTVAIYDNTAQKFIDITLTIKEGGLKWSRNDVDGANAGRNIEGTMERDRVATKIRMDITCILLTYSELQYIQELIYPEYIQVRYNDPLFGTRTVWMYANNNSSVFSHYDDKGVELWKEIAFPLIEV